MDSIYTRTITNEARRRGIAVRVIDREMPIFELAFKGRTLRCYNALTDRVGAVTFELAHDKFLASQFLRQHGFPVPDQAVYKTMRQALRFLRQHGAIVVKPNKEWGGRGVAVGVRDARALRQAVREAKRFPCDKTILEECVEGIDRRLITVGGRFVAAIERRPACVAGNGRDTLRALVREKNARGAADGNVIPLDAETRRNLASFGLSWSSVPRRGQRVQVRCTSNYHTGGSVRVITRSVDRVLVRTAEKVARLFRLPVCGVDFLVNGQTGRWHIIEVSADLAIWDEVTKRFMDYLFPGSRPGGSKGLR